MMLFVNERSDLFVGEAIFRSTRLLWGELLRERAAEAARQVRAGLGEGHLWRVVEVAPWSRVPEGRDLLVPFDG